MDSASFITSTKSGCLIKISAIKLLLPKTLRSNSRNLLFLENKSKNDSLALLDSINFTKFSTAEFAIGTLPHQSRIFGRIL